MPTRSPVREVLPEERRRSVRTFFLVLGAFLTALMLMVAILAAQGRVNRDYGQQVYRAVVAAKPAPQVSYVQKCVEALPRPLPAGVVACEVQVEHGRVAVTVHLEGGRLYRVDH